jgi:hypothetical protein
VMEVPWWAPAVPAKETTARAARIELKFRLIHSS